MKLIKANQQDVLLLQKIAREIIDTTYRGFLSDDSVTWFLSGPMDKYILEELSDCFVLKNNNEIIGFAVLKQSLIDLLMISKKKQKQGYGSFLLNECETILFKTSSEITLDSFIGNKIANDFYLKRNWIVFDEQFDEDSNGGKLIFKKNK